MALDPLTVAELEHRLTELRLKLERSKLEIPGVQQKRSWALAKRYAQQIQSYTLLLAYAKYDGSEVHDAAREESSR
jgi:hypothetical protein